MSRRVAGLTRVAAAVSSTRPIHLFYCLSGFIALGYQVAWLRIYADRFGSTDLTFALVLSNFIGGLGIGALASDSLTQRMARWPRLRDPLRQYGFVELCVCGAALLTLVTALVPLDLLGSFPYQLREGVFEPVLAYRAVAVAIATLCVFAPCFLMGITFPLLCYAYRGDDRFPSTLYAWNTLGACGGVLAAEFVLLPRIGHVVMFDALLFANALLAAYFVVLGGRGVGRASERGVLDPPAAAPDSRIEAEATGGLSPGVLLTCAVLSGLIAGSLEADLFKRASFMGIRTPATMSFISFWAVLAIFAGSWLVSALPRLRLRHIALGYTAAWIAFVALTQNAYAIHEWIFARLASPESQAVSLPFRIFFPAGRLPLLAYVGVLVFPSFLLVAMLLPYICNRIQSRKRHLGWVYGANTVAFCVGTIFFTWVAPRASIFYSLKLVVAVFSIGAALLWSLPEGRPLAGWKPLLAGLALLGAGVLTPAGFDLAYMIPNSIPGIESVRAVRSDSSHTTFVVRYEQGDALFFDNVSLSDASYRQRVYMSLMAHFPLLAHPKPEDVLLICYGVGNTAGAISAHETVRQIDVVELSRSVIDTAPEFARWNNGVHADPRVRFIHDDGRSYLKRTDQRYDLITSEPPPPLHAGVYRLYSREYYRDVLAHLTDRGIMTQWVPAAQLPPEALDRVIATFVAVFPHALLFTGLHDEFVLVGSSSPVELRNLERRFHESRRVAAHLEQLDVADPVALLARIVQGDSALRQRYGGGAILTDSRNDLDHFYLDPARRGIVPFDPKSVLADLRTAHLESWEALRGVMLHLGRLQHRVPGFPASSLADLRQRGAEGVAMLDVDWQKVRRLSEEAEQLRAQRRLAPARDTVRRALALAPEYPTLLRTLAQLQLALGEPEAALDAQRRFVALEPDDAIGLYQLAWLYERAGQLAVAVERYREALARDPDLSQAAVRLAWVLATTSDTSLRDGREALRWSDHRASGDAPRKPEALATAAAAHAAIGDFDTAARLQAEALALAPAQRAPAYRAGLELFAKGETLRDSSSAGPAYPFADGDSPPPQH